MPVTIKNGCLIEAFEKGEVNIIGHCTNSKGVMGSGVALALKKAYPQLYPEYRNYYEKRTTNGFSPFGEIHTVYVGEHKDEWRPRYIYNLHAQDDYGVHKRQLNYGALGMCLTAMFYGITQSGDDAVNDYDVVGFPYLMGCGLAGGEWSTVLEMIEFHSMKSGVDVIIYKKG